MCLYFQTFVYVCVILHADTLFFIAKYTPESKAHVFNAGAPVWGMDWCPIHALDRPGENYSLRPPSIGIN